MPPILVSDLDGTLCELGPSSDYLKAPPRKDVIAKVNQLYDDHWTVIIFTARGMSQFSGDLARIEKEYREGTEKWLKENGVKYHVLKFGKPGADIYIDDKGMTIDGFLSSKIESRWYR